jgi:hypothetical protein
MSAPLAVTEAGRLQCEHHAKLENKPSQDMVRVSGERVLVASDPEGRRIHGCPNVSPSTRPCITSLRVDTGYSQFVAVDGHAICLSTLEGLTDGTPPGATHYTVADPGQDWVVIAV